MLVAGPEIPGSSFITGNVVGNLISSTFVQDSLLINRLAEATQISYRGVENVDDVVCHVIDLRVADTDVDSDIAQSLYIGVDDYLLRRSITSYTYAEKARQQERVVHDLVVNLNLPDSTFLLALPEGYRREDFHEPEGPELLASGVAAPEWTLLNASGQPVSLQSFRGNLVLLDFWYTTCSYCILAMPMTQKLHERFKDRGVVVYGVNPWQKDSADAIRFMQRKGYSYGLVLNGVDVATLYHVTGYPTFYLIGDDGTVLFRGVGYRAESEEELVGVIEKYLHERGR